MKLVICDAEYAALMRGVENATEKWKKALETADQSTEEGRLDLWDKYAAYILAQANLMDLARKYLKDGVA